MECPYCNGELIYHDYYGKRLGREDELIEGEIFKCPNYEDFENKNIAISYAIQNNIEYDELDWEYIMCKSSTFNGSFYTNSNDELKEGYPC